MPISRRQFSSIIGAAAFSGLTSPHYARANSGGKLSFLIGTSPPDPACHFYYYGKTKGFYKDLGLDLEINTIGAALNATKAIIAGEADVAWVDGTSSILARAANVKIKCVSSFTPTVDYFIVTKKSIQSIGQLAKVKFGIGSIGGATQVIPRLLIEREGVSAQGIEWLNIGNNAVRSQALISGVVDATLVTSSFVPRIEGYSQLHVLGSVADLLPDMCYSWDIAHETVVEKKAELLAAFVAGTTKAVRWAEQNSEEAADISVSLLPAAPKDELRAAVKGYIARRFWKADGIVPTKTVDFTSKTLVSAGQLNRDVAYIEMVAEQIAKRAQSLS